jgi:hypothetical protein
MRASGHRAAAALIVGAVIVSLGLTLQAQRGGGQGRGRQQGGSERFQTGGQIEGNIPYDGRFTFVRLSYQSGFSRRGPAWAHDYPRGERHFMKILNSVSLTNPHMDESNVMALDNPELFKFPVAYMAEPGYWFMSEPELAGLKAYIAKGGFLIFDDFRNNNEWYNLEAQMSRVFPQARWVDMSMDHPIFHSFFDINSMDIIPQYYDTGSPMLRGLFEDNDPKKRLIAIANFNTDMSEFWEFSDTGIRTIDESNEAYKLGVNYIIYGITH